MTYNVVVSAFVVRACKYAENQTIISVCTLFRIIDVSFCAQFMSTYKLQVSNLFYHESHSYPIVLRPCAGLLRQIRRMMHVERKDMGKENWIK